VVDFGAHIRVLIADEPAFASALRVLLESQPGIEVVAIAPDGSAAVELAAELMPDVIVMDARLPVLDGFAAARVIRDAEVAAAIVLLTDVDELEVRDMDVVGANAFVARSEAAVALPAVLREIALLSPAAAPR
jgi:DNA-binding NarL/FixJ family response regulator